MERRSTSAAYVRMYRQGLGDCLLITLPRAGAAPMHLLIDCGVLLGTPNASDKMIEVARDIAATTEGRLDVVIATHEHWDHVSGFLQARSVFDEIDIGEVWLAWTEDPADAVASRLRQQRQQALQGLRVVAGRLASMDADAATQLRGPLAFFGAASGPTTRDALDYLVNHRSGPRIRYHRPGGEAIALPGVGAAKAYVLGPPRNESMLRRSRPTKAGHEVYELVPSLALLSAVAGAPHESERAQAFEPRYRVPVERAAGQSFFQTTFFCSDDAWRRIDGDWLGAAEQLALALDSHTNNTSLVLAFELEPGGRVLLFPGDAQVGNWLSWYDCDWHAVPPVNAADLLRRTVLYKVGHHGSHNATLRERGLEQMLSTNLVALITVDRAMAERKRWNMPFPALLDRLREQTRGRVLCADTELPDRPPTSSASEWQSFLDQVVTGPNGLYYEYKLAISDTQ